MQDENANPLTCPNSVNKVMIVTAEHYSRHGALWNLGPVEPAHTQSHSNIICWASAPESGTLPQARLSLLLDSPNASATHVISVPLPETTLHLNNSSSSLRLRVLVKFRLSP